jgi:glycosyltransferase involved in cell wall biosynthesis
LRSDVPPGTAGILPAILLASPTFDTSYHANNETLRPNHRMTKPLPWSTQSSSSLRKYNVLLLNSMKFMGGGETWMLGMAKHLAQRGHKPFLTARPKTMLLKLARESGLPAMPLWISGDLNPILLWRLATIIRENKIDLIIANTARDIRIAGLVTHFQKGVSVVGLHQVDLPIKNKWNYRLTFKTFADAIVVNSLSTKRTLLENNPWLPQNKIRVVPHGINTSKYQGGNPAAIRASLGIPADAFMIGFVGRLSGQKGVSVLLGTIEENARKAPDTHFVIAGIGTLEKKVVDFVKSSGLSATVHFLGFRDDVPLLMQSFDLLLVPSLWEGFGLVLIEAMSAGVPCIASNVSSIPEILEDGVNGLLVPPGNVEALVSAVERLRSDPALRKRLGDAGKRTVDEKFTIDRMMAGYEELFGALVGQASS